MNHQDISAPAVLCTERATYDGRRIGIATLNRPRTLNGLSLQMVQQLDQHLRRWALDTGIVLVVLQGAGEKGFCAGGDLHALYHSMQATGSAGGQTNTGQASPGQGVLDNPYAVEFFAREYCLDYLIHTYPKPVLCWGHGIVMGGGIGLMAGASHRVVSEHSKLAFPEITVGLFPDVAGSWLLNQVPGNGGQFLALTSASLNAGDAIYARLADIHLPRTSHADVLDALCAQIWSHDVDEQHAHLSAVLGKFSVPTAPGPLQQHAALIADLCSGDDLAQIVTAIITTERADHWWKTAQAALLAGAPGSARLGFELQSRAARLTLAETFQLEYMTVLHCVAHGDFCEGIRALLIDKDRSPRWNPSTLADAHACWVQTFFTPPPWPGGVHPLADLTGQGI